MSAALEIDGLVKCYGDLVAVDGISLRVEEGDFFAFLGPNGAGKTTTINAIVSLVRKTSGSIRIFGLDSERDWREARRLVGLSAQEYNFDRYLSLRDILIFQAGYYALTPRQVGARVDELLERFGLTSKANVEYLRLSGGMKRRLTIARALVHAPRLLILDEPTAGVDVELRLELWDFLRELNAQGTTIFLTTHYLEEAEALCRTVGIVRQGKLVAMQPTKQLLAERGETALVFTVAQPVRALPDVPALAGAHFEVGDSRVCLNGVRAESISSILSAMESAGFIVEGVDFRRSSLQEIFLELTRR